MPGPGIGFRIGRWPAVALLVTILVSPGRLHAKDGAPGAPSSATAAPVAPAAPQASNLAKDLANPISSLVSVPFQLNWDGSVGPEDQTRFQVNFQPVMPFRLSPSWNVIARVIVPLVSQPVLVPGGTPRFGVSDIVASAFFSPAGRSSLTWGVGPVFLLPTTADPYLGTAKWGAGPTVVALKQAGPWTTGALANHLWSFAGDEDRDDVNQTFVQPFLAYTTANSWTFTLTSESTANWEAPSGQEWTVPLILTAGKVLKIGKRPASVGFGVSDYLETPDGGPEWKIRTFLTLLYPA